MAIFSKKQPTNEEQMLRRQSAPTPTAEDELQNHDNDVRFAYDLYNNERANEQTLYNANRQYALEAANNLFNQEYGAYQQDISQQQWNHEYDLRKTQGDQSATIASLKERLAAKNDTMIDMSSMSKYESKLNPIISKYKALSEKTFGPINWNDAQKEIDEIINDAADKGEINEAEYNYLEDKYSKEIRLSWQR